MPVRIPLGMLNRHGLVVGATGTGKTRGWAEHLHPERSDRNRRRPGQREQRTAPLRSPTPPPAARRPRRPPPPPGRPPRSAPRPPPPLAPGPRRPPPAVGGRPPGLRAPRPSPRRARRRHSWAQPRSAAPISPRGRARTVRTRRRPRGGPSARGTGRR
ncbi:hypothetical protein C5C67_16760 [Rathayibacter sp. AY1E1]|nr:hypothetical protein C5C67_16760 [Rathayibacter sp. AY1E1]